MKTRSWIIDVWEEPQNGEDYVIGGDPAGGMSTSDWSVAHVLKCSEMRVVACVRDKIDPDMYGKMIESLGYTYNTARVCIERNRDGQAVNNFLMNRGYGNIHFDTEIKIRGNTTDAKPGLYTGKTNKMEIISILQGVVHDELITIPHEQTIKELDKFVKNDKGMGQAQQGFHDDCVMSLACAVYAHAQFGYDRTYGSNKKERTNKKKTFDTTKNPHAAAEAFQR